LLLVLVLVLTLSGLYGLFWTDSEWMFVLHRASGWGLLALLPWKAVIIFRSLQRRTRNRGDRQLDLGWLSVSVFLTILTLAVLALGLLWKGRFGPVNYPLRQTAIAWHWMLALALLLPFVLHVWKRWPRPRRVDFLTRRAFLRTTLISSLAGVGFLAYLELARSRQLPQEPIRFTGSRQAGWFSGNNFPLTHNKAPDPDQIALQNWQLEVAGAVENSLRLDYDSLNMLPMTEYDATIDCTLGWYARQTWRGVLLVVVLEQAGLKQTPTAVHLASVTGYEHILPWAEAQHILLATHVGGELLSADHGYPLRAVVPSRRGWFWVKWLSQVRVV
jgi:DMSO/TMAO reductase YedYZ molybdopterin-dependent catalytic subunit